MQEAIERRLLILSSEAGAGKTVTFEHFALRMKQKYPAWWVSYIDLKYNIKYFEKNGTDINVEEVLNEVLNLELDKNEFEKKLFNNLFQAGKAVLLWNGFDEISPTYNEFVLNMMKNIYDNSKNVQFVCTRPIYSNQLRENFKSRPWELIPYNTEQKNEFLNKTFQFQKVSDEKIAENIAKVEEIIDKKLDYKTRFEYSFDSPLMLTLISQIFEEKNVASESLNIWDIYNSFVYKKIKKWSKNNDETEATAIQLILDSKIRVTEIFQKYALSFFIRYSSTSFSLKSRKLQIFEQKIPKKFPLELISDMDILYINGPGNFEFAHKTFEEFFIAQYFIENLLDNDKNLEYAEAVLRLENFFTLNVVYVSFQKIITRFMYSYLKSTKREGDEKFNPVISKLLRTKFKKFFFLLLDTDYQEIFEFLFEFFNIEHDLLVELLHVNEDETFYTAIFNPNHFSLFINPEYIKSLARKYLSDEEFLKFVNGRDQKGVILYGMKFYQMVLEIEKSNENYNNGYGLDSNDSIWEFLDKTLENTTKIERKNLIENVLNPKMYMYYKQPDFFHDDIYTIVWAKYEGLLEENEKKEVVQNALDQYFWTYPNETYDEGLLDFLLTEKVQKFMSSSEIWKMFRENYIMHRCVWNVNNCIALWDFLSNHTDKMQRREILFQDDIDSYNAGRVPSDKKLKYFSKEYFLFFYDYTPFKVLHVFMIYSYLESFPFIKKIYEDNFNQTEIQDIMMSSENLLYYAVNLIYVENFRDFKDFLETLFKDNEKKLKDFFEEKVSPGNLSTIEYIKSYAIIRFWDTKFSNNLEALLELYERLKKL